MKIIAVFFDEATGNEIDRVHTDLRTFCDENPNAPPQVIRQEMREIGAYITVSNGIRCEVVKP